MQFMSNDHKRLGLYFHIPFCRSKCAYCDFNSAPPSSDEIVTEYINALIAHMEDYREAVRSYEPDTVFIGGGTPTSIPPSELVRLIRAIRKNFRLAKDAEFTVEANPATVTYPTLLKLHRLGVNRLSIGLQSAHENELKSLSRIHTRQDFVRSYRMAREARFDNINIDLMFGIPGQTPESLAHTMRWVASLRPEHISLYDLKIEPNTAFGKNYEEIAPLLPDEDTEADMYIASIDSLYAMDYEQYEISNFSRPGFRCRHNLKYWNCDEYLGFGVSAHSFFNGNRFSWTPNIRDYIQGVTVKDSKVRLTDENEAIGERERMGEYIILRLRLTDGISEREFSRRFGLSFETLYGEKCRKFIQHGFMTAKNGRFALTPSGMFISNYILTELLEFEDFGKYQFGG